MDLKGFSVASRMDRDNVMVVAMAATGGDGSWSSHGNRTTGTLILAIVVVVIRVVVVGKHDCRLCCRGRSTTGPTGGIMTTRRRRRRRRSGATRTLVLFLGMTMPFLVLAGTLVGLGKRMVGLV